VNVSELTAADLGSPKSLQSLYEKWYRKFGFDSFPNSHTTKLNFVSFAFLALRVAPDNAGAYFTWGVKNWRVDLIQDKDEDLARSMLYDD